MPWRPSFPAVRHYPDGRQVLVTSPAELDALAPGHGDAPGGPFQEPPAPGEQGPSPAPAAPAAPAGGARQARQMRDEGRTQQAIADELGVSRRTVRQWLKQDFL